MTANQFRRTLEKAGRSQRAVAQALEINERTVRRYVAGDQPVPRVVEFALLWLLSQPQG